MFSKGENLVSLSDSCPLKDWYGDGPTLVDAIDSFQYLATATSFSPLRAVVEAVENPTNIQVSVLQGRIAVKHTIALYCSSAVSIQVPVVFTVAKISISSKEDINSRIPVDVLTSGQRGFISISSKSLDIDYLKQNEGKVIIFKGKPILNYVKVFKSVLTTLSNIPLPIIPGRCFTIYIFGSEMECRIDKIKHIADDDNNNTKKKLKYITSSMTVQVTITLEKPMLLDLFTTCPVLGRFALREKGYTYAYGHCKKILS